MPTINDDILAATGGPTHNEGLATWFSRTAIETLQDAERRWLLTQPGAAGGAIADLWYATLRAAGFTGSMNDMKAQYWAQQASLFTDFLAVFDATTIINTNPVIEWQNKQPDAAAFDLDVPVGTGANLTALKTGVALFPGVAGDYFSTPSSPAANVPSDITLEWVGTVTTWASSNQVFIAKEVDGSNRAYRMKIEAGGVIELALSTDGTNTVSASSSIAPGFANGDLGGVRAKRSNGLDQVIFEKTLDGGNTWTPFGTNPQALVLGGIDSNSSPVEIGSRFNGTVDLLKGTCNYAKVYNDATATNVVVHFQPSKATSSNAGETFVSDTGEIWTAQGDTFINASGYTGIYSRDDVGLETTVGQNIGNPSIIFAVFKSTILGPGANQNMIHARADVGATHQIFTNNANSNKWALAQGADIALAGDYDTDLHVFTGQYNGDATSKLTVSDVGSVTGDAGSQIWDFATIFANNTGGSTIQGLFLFFAVIEEALSEDEITEIQNFLQAKYLG